MTQNNDDLYTNTDIVFDVDHSNDWVDGAPKEIEVVCKHGIAVFVRPPDEVL